MDYIKIVLLIYLVLRILNITPNQKFSLNNYMQNTFLIALLILLSAHDPVVAMLVIIAILINLPNEYKENLFTKINKTDIDELTKTLPFMQKEKQQPTKTVVSPTNTQPVDVPKNTKLDCVPEFIISKDMLNNAQNNLIEENISLFPNEMKEKHVNIQGYFSDIKGFNI
jgi:hypothetical protein